jgi:hypothetical protein
MEDGTQVRPKCRRCSAEMEETTSIAPFGADPGLHIFECSSCGSATSRLEPGKSGTKGRVTG